MSYTIVFTILFNFFNHFPLKVNSKNTNIKNIIYVSLGILFFAIQAYSSYYLAWFYACGLILSLLCGLLYKNSREKIKEYFKNYNKTFVLPIILSFCALLPLIYHYLLTGHIVEKSYAISILNTLISQSLLNKLFINLSKFYYCENAIGIGFITTIILLCAIFKSKYRFLILTLLITIFLIFTNNFTHEILYKYFLPMQTIRVMGRFAFLLLIIYPIILLFFLRTIKSKILLTILLFLMTIEQIPHTNQYKWTKKEHNERISKINLDKNCQIVATELKDPYDVSGNTNQIMDIIWYSSINNIHTTNGYSALIYYIDTKNLDKKCIQTLNNVNE